MQEALIEKTRVHLCEGFVGKMILKLQRIEQKKLSITDKQCTTTSTMVGSICQLTDTIILCDRGD